MRVLVTGADGFVGRNLCQHLRERPDTDLSTFTRADAIAGLTDKLRGIDVIFHLAGVNRPKDPIEFRAGNTELTHCLRRAVEREHAESGRAIVTVYASSAQAALDNPYGSSKRSAEETLVEMSETSGLDVYVFRLPNVFGKWSRPDYNSVVATFCHNLARGLPIRINDPDARITLVYVDDVVAAFVSILDGVSPQLDEHGFATVAPQYSVTVGQLADKVAAYAGQSEVLMLPRVGDGLERALYSTFLSFLPESSFNFRLQVHADPRGKFVEILKTPDCGQVSFFTCAPGVTRGGHYHHTKNERFLVVKGRARFRFRHVQSGAVHELVTSEASPEVVMTVPGWAHDITNIGDAEMVVMLWANEVFDPARPDTYSYSL